MMNHVQDALGEIITIDWDGTDPAYVDAIDKPPCPRCSSSRWELDGELHAWLCEDCGLWRDEPDEL